MVSPSFRNSKLSSGESQHLEQIEVFGRDHARIDHGFEIDDLLPVLAAVDDDDNLLGQFLGLGEGEDFKKFVERAESAGKITSALARYANQNLRMKK